MKRYDVAVIGGGPIGALAARYAALTGARVLLMEQGSGTGAASNCTGLISPRTLAIYSVSSTTVLRRIKGGRLHLPGGETWKLWAPDTRALVIDRAAFDRLCLEKAANAGVEVRTHTRVTHAVRGRVTINGKEKVEAAVIVGADGPTSSVRNWFSLPPPPQFLTAIQAIVEGTPENPEQVEVFVGRDIAPGGFAWAVPAEAGTLRVGLLAPAGTDVQRLLSRLLTAYFPGRIRTHGGGLIPIGPAERTYSDGAIVVGDAAGQVKPLSGGGLYFGGVCAQIAGKVAGQAGLSGLTSEAYLRLYEEEWKREIGYELDFGLSLRQIFFSLDDETLTAIKAIFDDPEILSLIENYGDFDYPSKLISVFLEHRTVWPRLASAVPLVGGWNEVQKLAAKLFPTWTAQERSQYS